MIVPTHVDDTSNREYKIIYTISAQRHKKSMTHKPNKIKPKTDNRLQLSIDTWRKLSMWKQFSWRNCKCSRKTNKWPAKLYLTYVELVSRFCRVIATVLLSIYKSMAYFMFSQTCFSWNNERKACCFERFPVVIIWIIVPGSFGSVRITCTCNNNSIFTLVMVIWSAVMWS